MFMNVSNYSCKRKKRRMFLSNTTCIMYLLAIHWIENTCQIGKKIFSRDLLWMSFQCVHLFFVFFHPQATIELTKLKLKVLNYLYGIHVHLYFSWNFNLTDFEANYEIKLRAKHIFLGLWNKLNELVYVQVIKIHNYLLNLMIFANILKF